MDHLQFSGALIRIGQAPLFAVKNLPFADIPAQRPVFCYDADTSKEALLQGGNCYASCCDSWYPGSDLAGGGGRQWPVQQSGVGRALCPDGGGLRVFRLGLLEKGKER